MRLRHIVSTAVFLPGALLCSAAASATVINFDDLATGALVTDQYLASLGVTFSDSFSGGSITNSFLATLIPGSSAPNVVLGLQGSGSLTGQYIEVTFATPVSGVSTLFGTSLGANITLEAFNGANLIDSVTTTGPVQTGDVQSGNVGVTDTGITSVRLSSPSSGGASFNFSFDNFTFGQAAAVPEPSSWVMMLAGFGMIGAMMQRSRRRQIGGRRASA